MTSLERRRWLVRQVIEDQTLIASADWLLGPDPERTRRDARERLAIWLQELGSELSQDAAE